MSDSSVIPQVNDTTPLIKKIPLRLKRKSPTKTEGTTALDDFEDVDIPTTTTEKQILYEDDGTVWKVTIPKRYKSAIIAGNTILLMAFLCYIFKDSILEYIKKTV